jgi:hypothetical protein
MTLRRPPVPDTARALHIGPSATTERKTMSTARIEDDRFTAVHGGMNTQW